MIPRYTRPDMEAIWTDEARFRLWLEIETLALEAMVKEGIAPEKALESVREKGNFNTQRVLEIENTVKHDVIAFLTNVAEYVGEDARYLHYGMTSSDLLDTAFSVQLCRATDLIMHGLLRLCDAVKDKASAYRDTVCIGRSHGIHAEPITFGLKFAVWYAELKRHEKRLRQAREDIAVGAISGAVGTYAHLTPAVEAHVCQALGLKPESATTQVIQRDHHAALFCAFAQLGSTIEKIGVEIRHLQRTEVREAEEGFAKGQKGSSAMPHKRNPILSENICGLARLLRSYAAVGLENVALWHERDISHSSAERVIAPDATIALDFMLARTTSIVGNLRVYPENMEKNLEMTGGIYYSGTLLLALAEKGVSREKAYEIVQRRALETWEALSDPQAKDTRAFPQRIREDREVRALLSEKELDDVFSLKRHLRHLGFIFDRVFSD